MNKSDWKKYTRDILLNGNHIDDDYSQYMNDRYHQLIRKCTRLAYADVTGAKLGAFIDRLCRIITADETGILRLHDIANDSSTSDYFVNDMAVISCSKMFINQVIAINNEPLKSFQSDYKDGRNK